MTRRLKKSCAIFLACSILSGCAKVTVENDSIRAHWIEENETAPFRGILLNDYTYYRLRMKLIECEKGRQ